MILVFGLIGNNMIKKILIITDDFIHNSQKASAVLIKELAIAIDKSSSYKSIVIAPDIESNFIKRFKTESIDTITFPSGKLKNTNLFRRVFNEYKLSIGVKRCYSLIDLEDVSGVVYYSPSIFFGEAVRFLKQKFQCSSYLILRDLFPQWLVDLGLIKNHGPAHLILKYFERSSLSNADRIGVMSNGNLNLFSNRNDFNKFEVLPNWQTPKRFNKNTKSLKKHGLENLKDKFVFFYGGNIGLAQGVDYLLNLANLLLTEKNIHFLFVGQGDAIDLITQRNLPNTSYIESLKQNDYFELVSNFDVGIFSLHKNHTAHNFPGKLYGYMSMSKPVIGIVNEGNDAKELINDADAGLICYHNEGHNKLISHCKKLSKDLIFQKKQGKNSLNIVLGFTPDVAAEQILSYFNNKL